MNKQIDFSQPGGMLLFQEALAFMQQAYSQPLDAIGALCGSKVIVSGVEAAGGLITDGWIAVNGELIPFTGGAPADYVIVQTTVATEQFDDGTQKPVYSSKKASLSNLLNGDSFPFVELARLSTLKNIWLKGDVKQVHCDNAYVAANFDPTGLGVGERKGWAVCNGQNGTFNMAGRVAVGLQFPAIPVNPADNVWDALYNWAVGNGSGMGKTGGEKLHKLTITEMPQHSHKAYRSNSGYDGGGGASPLCDPTTGDTSKTELDWAIKPSGGDQPHENRQPFLVSLFIQKL